MKSSIYPILLESIKINPRNIRTKKGLWCYFSTDGNTIFVNKGTMERSNSKIRSPRPLNQNEADSIYRLWKAGKPFSEASSLTMNASYWFAILEDVFGK